MEIPLVSLLKGGLCMAARVQIQVSNNRGLNCLNHLISTGYRVIYDLVLCKIHRLPHNED